MVLENFFIVMETNMKVNIKTIIRMVLENIFIVMEINLKVNIKTVKQMVLENNFSATERYIVKVNGKKVNSLIQI